MHHEPERVEWQMAFRNIDSTKDLVQPGRHDGELSYETTNGLAPVEVFPPSWQYEVQDMSINY